MPVADMGFVLRERGTTAELGAHVVAVAEAGGRFGFALGDGTLRVGPSASSAGWDVVPVHDGAVLSMVASGAGWVTGGDDGRLCRVAGTAVGQEGVEELARFGSRWVEHVAVSGGMVAAGVGKAAHVFGADGKKLKELVHPSSVTGLAFDAKGKRVAASHYNGASLWFVGAREDKARVLEWKGSHTGLALHPDGDAVVTAMQENALHGWRLADGQHMRMSGYPAKCESLSFSRKGRWLASAGAEAVVLWPFFGGGPMGKQPLELAGGDQVLCTRVAFHPRDEMVAAGFSDGLVVLAEIASERVLPVAPPRGSKGGAGVSALGWSADGTRLAFGTEDGFAGVVDLGRG